MTNGHAQSERIHQIELQLLFPKMGAIAVAAPAIGQDQKLQPLGKGLSSKVLLLLLPDKGIHGKLRGVRRLTDGYIAPIMQHVIDSVGNSLSHGVAGKVMDVDLGCLSTPYPVFILKPPNQLFFSVSTLIIGQPAFRNAATWAWMY